jgi:hypothetical protein
MRLAIMQPYFLPYIGYFQLIKAVDKYVIYDDVNFIKGGWINRNKILLNGSAFMINVPMLGASPNKKINEIQVGHNKQKLLQTIIQAYSKSPYFKNVIPLVSEIINYENENLAQYIANSIIQIAKYLQINTEFILSSEISKNNELKAQDKVISICKILNADTYLNAFGGQELYSKTEFEKNKIVLKFLETNHIEYNQFKNDFIPGLSIIDILMFNSVEEIRLILSNFTLI